MERGSAPGAPRSRSRSQGGKVKGKGQTGSGHSHSTAKAKSHVHEETSVTQPSPLAEDASATAEGLHKEKKHEGDADADLIARSAAGSAGWLLEELLDLRGSLRRQQEQHERHKKTQEHELAVVKEAVKALQEESGDMRGQVHRMRVVVQNLHSAPQFNGAVGTVIGRETTL